MKMKFLLIWRSEEKPPQSEIFGTLAKNSLCIMLIDSYVKRLHAGIKSNSPLEHKFKCVHAHATMLLKVFISPRKVSVLFSVFFN